MKKLILILICAIYTDLASATEQVPDKLIIGKDTICLKSFPLENLNFKKSPFKYGEFNFPSTECWRGYIATWEIIKGELYLVSIQNTDSTNKEVNIEKFFKDNEYEFIVKNGKIKADWYSGILGKYNSLYRDDSKCICERFDLKSRQKIRIEIENGIVTYNSYQKE